MDKFNSLPIVREFMCAETLQNRLLHFKLDHRKKFKRGSYGVVCFYISTETNNDGTYWHLCIKHTHDKNEIKMINSFEEGEVKCGQVEAKLLQYNGNDHYTKHTYKKKVNGVKKTLTKRFYAYVMPDFPRTLKDFVGQQFTKETIVKIIKSLNDQLKCLRRNNLCYMDIKPENILSYEREPGNNNSIEVVLGDIGSNNKSTLYCPMAADPRHPTCKNGEIGCAAFSLTVLAAQLLLSKIEFENREAYPWINYAKNGGDGREMAMDEAKEFLRKDFPELLTLLFTPRFLYHQSIANFNT